MLDRCDQGGKSDLHLTAEQIVHGGSSAPVRHVHHVDSSHHLEQLAEQMGSGPGAARSKVELARIGLSVGDELRNRLRRNRWMHKHDLGLTSDACDRGDVADEIEVEPFVERRVDRVVRGNHEERIAVGRRAHDRLGGDIAGARPVVDDEWLTEPIGKPLPGQPRKDVGRAARGNADHDTHRPRRIGPRPSEARQRWKCGSTRCQM